MEEIRRHDQALFFRELRRPGRVFWWLVFSAMALAISLESEAHFGLALAITLIPSVWAGLSAFNAAVRRRFIHQRFSELWEGCRDRHARFEAVITQMRRDQIADLQEMPKTIRRVAEALYISLRRADLITDDVQRTEKDVIGKPPAWGNLSRDPQAQEMYRVADKNIAEYRQHFTGVMAGVQRVEAQAAVYMTTVDSLRMKMIGHRMAGRSPELAHNEFLGALNEAKLQLQAIDTALDELDFASLGSQTARRPIDSIDLEAR